MGCIPPSKITNLVNDEMEDMVKNAKKKNYINEIFNIRNNRPIIIYKKRQMI